MYTNSYYSNTKLLDVIVRFLEGEQNVAEYKYAEADYANADSAVNSLRAASKRFRMNVKVFKNYGKVYMARI